MYLVRLIYVSKVVNEQFSNSDIEEILAAARKHNKVNNVTGLLCFDSHYFLQCLEGSRSKVNETYQHILVDSRHTNIQLLNYQEISERDFADWGMGYVPGSSLTQPLTIKCSGSNEFKPYDMSGKSCHKMLTLLRDTVPVI
jgi:hypothetical protein